MKNNLAVILFLFSFVASAQLAPIDSIQEHSIAWQIVRELSSEKFGGRGYGKPGANQAAQYISNKLRKQGAVEIRKQPFPISHNTILHCELTMEGRLLREGADYLLKPFSSSASASGKVFWFAPQEGDTTVEGLRKKLAQAISSFSNYSFFAFHRSQFNKAQYSTLEQIIIQNQLFLRTPVLEYTTEKLTHSASTVALPVCWVVVARQQTGDIVASLKVKNKFRQRDIALNVITVIEGSRKPDSLFVFTAHYDHLGKMGRVFFPGANDNASGVSMLLSLHRYFQTNKPSHSIAFIFFSGEESGLLGSEYFTMNPVFALSRIRFLLNLDIVGTGEEGVKVVNATVHPTEFDRLVSINSRYQFLKTVAPRGPAANSDHFPFYEKGVPCFFMYTMGGIAAYHDIWDKAETLPLNEFIDLMELLIQFTASF